MSLDQFSFDEITRDCTIVVMGPYDAAREVLQQYCKLQDPEHHLEYLIELDLRDTLRRYIQEQRSATYADRHVSLILENLTQSQYETVKDELYFICLNVMHDRMSLVITTEHLSLGPLFRTNVDYFVTWPKNSLSLQDLHYKWFAGMFPSLDAFKSYVEKLDPDIALVGTLYDAKWYRSVAYLPPPICYASECKEGEDDLHVKINS